MSLCVLMIILATMLQRSARLNVKMQLIPILENMLIPNLEFVWLSAQLRPLVPLAKMILILVFKRDIVPMKDGLKQKLMIEDVFNTVLTLM